MPSTDSSMMKKLSLCFFVGLLAISSATIGHAQQMLFGVRGGINFADQKWSSGGREGSPANITWRPGMIAGGEFDYSFDRSWAAIIQFLYDQKGARSNMFGIAVGPLPGPADWIASYVEVPLLARVNIGNSEAALCPYLFAGPSVGFLISNIESHYSNSSNITDSTTKIDFSLIAGAGLSLRLVAGAKLFLDAGYAFGLTNVDNYFNDEANELYVYSRDIRISAGVLFPLN